MTNKDKKLEIIKLITLMVKDRYKRHLEALSNLEAEKTKEQIHRNTAKSQWDDDYSGGFGPQPPNVDLYRNKESTARAEFDKWESIYNYALDNLISDE
jgi:hypothetical protein